MSVDTYVKRAIDRVEGEQELLAGEVTALDRFAAGVADLEPVTPAESTGAVRPTSGGATPAATGFQRTASGTRRIERVRELFAETVRPHSADDGSETLDQTIEEELGPEIATVLSPSTPGGFTAEVKGAIRSTVAQRRAERCAVERALDHEEASLTAALEGIEEITDWLVAEDRTPLVDLGFEALRDRHEALAAHRSRCERISRERQEVLHGTTSHEMDAGLTQLSLVGYLYDDLETTFPVLRTVVRLERVCRESQRAVRDHLTRRV